MFFHKFVSSFADGPDTTKLRPSKWNEVHKLADGGVTGKFLRYNSAAGDGSNADLAWIEDLFLPSATMLNNSGGSVVAGDVVVLDSAANNAFKKIASQGSLLPVFIVQETINAGATGRVKQVGYAASVAVNGAVTRGNFLRTSATSGYAEDAGANAVDGVFAVAFTGFGGPGTGTVAALLLGTTMQVKAVGGYAVQGLVVDWASATTLDISADHVTLRHKTTGRAMEKLNTGVRTLNISNSGLLGRDQTGAFSANSWVHFYEIGREDTGATSVVASASAPPTGPDLDTIAALQPYDFWSYLGSWRLDGSTSLLRGRQRGDLMEYEPEQNVLNDGTATSETAVSLSSVVPPNAKTVRLHINAAGSTASQANALRLRLTSGVEWRNIEVRTATTIEKMEDAPNVGQNIYYLRQTALATDIFVTGYTVPNGG